jgi:hypothetical protein
MKNLGLNALVVAGAVVFLVLSSVLLMEMTKVHADPPLDITHDHPHDYDPSPETHDHPYSDEDGPGYHWSAEVSTRRITIVDEKGNPRIVLGVHGGKEYIFFLRDGESIEKALLDFATGRFKPPIRMGSE